MANPFSKAQIGIATGAKRAFPFNQSHITTADFFGLAPVFHRELVPNSDIKIDFNAFARLAALSVPTYGDAKLHLRAFFVPMRTIYRGWDDFITDALHVNSGSQYATHDEQVPLVTNRQFLDLFRRSAYSSTVSTPQGSESSANFDFTIINSQTGTASYKKFTPLGRQAFKIIRSLGYQVEMAENDGSNDLKYSALPLLSFLRAYLDWYYPSQYYGDTASALLGSLCLRDTSVDPSFNVDRLAAIFDVVCYTSYADDYFTSAFDSPNGPTPVSSVGASYFSISDISQKAPNQGLGSKVYSNDSDGDIYQNTPYIASDDDPTDAPKMVTQYVLDTLKSLSDFMKRHQLVGARSFERFVARFGVELPTAKLNRSYYLGSHEISLAVQDVMATADTEGAALGDYAGKGLIVGQNGHFEYHTDEFGYFMICASITPEIGYVQGVDRKVLHRTKLEFFAPEFDSNGTQPISRSELYVPNVLPSDMQTTAGYTKYFGISEKVFAFINRYAEYKVGRNQLTGDFTLASLQLGDTSPAWHLNRMFNFDSWADQSYMIHDKNFVMPGNGYAEVELAQNASFNQYNRIFGSTSAEADHFYLVYNFRVLLQQPMRPLFDTYEFKDEDEHGKRVIDVNGVKFN